ncbi:MAG: hypothetical protein KA151_10295 [Piscinibacter sp.]|jgi:uncharacterized protein YidB (DUF937 family)|nr:hypothetical protein [Piscinibacter sp.]
MTINARELHLHIGRLSIAAPAGSDHRALARQLAAQLPAAIAQHLQAEPAIGAAPVELHERLAAAIAPQVAARLEPRQ